MNPHLHKYRFNCEMSSGHSHKMSGCTENMIGINAFHFHYFCGISSYNDHTHYYSGITGMPVKTENGHIHRIEGIAESNNIHEHKYSNFTNEDIEYISKRLSGEAYV